ncbi:NTP transferase domain-containing protein [Prochlorococcus marinus XMU1411]|uniref:sugar phosphate nucleotidyltransferase n=1 Tax=Prochlorococcus marinus TaxID=1219 RepID=UPI001ADD0F92|nr:sugar phosphate nucleotidyltransferase [Prochlorococcus marinus]MBO8244227.1 NTP transferase domain-containing protein [Prochlorococcus marinus XMU1411]MBW3055313.1 hypothetical protein [Prochlorococcus marinus str. MU1411]MCR8537055.1 sugar phosphate nucleotidyltransferase [Prochlorococcus marinus CUG1430]
MKYTLLIQAGGSGKRLKTFTKNKPKALVTYNSKPLVSHLIDVFSIRNICERVIIIVDYKEDIFMEYLPYLKNFHPEIKIDLISSKPAKGTVAGLKKTIKEFDISSPILYSWCDLVPTYDYQYYKKMIKEVIKIKDKITIFYSKGVTCRWSIERKNNKINLIEKSSSEKGVLGIFYIPNKKLIDFYGDSGEFVRLMSEKINFKFINIKSIDGFLELGDYENLISLYNEKNTTRYFNKIKFDNGKIIKESVFKDFQKLIKREYKWYLEVLKLGYMDIPKGIIKDGNKLIMEKINGKSYFEIQNEDEMLQYTKYCYSSLSNLHNLNKVPIKINSLEEVYLNKTIQRIESVFSLLPKKESKILINNIECINLVAHSNWRDLLKEKFKRLSFISHFRPIHGDPTLSNNIYKSDSNCVKFIDPRGYFYDEGIYGDPRYDLAKLYYSIKGGYDFFNRKLFDYEYNEKVFNFSIWRKDNLYLKSIKWLEKKIKNIDDIKIIHSFIWLSLTGYCVDDYDSIITSYFIGCQYFSLLKK